MSDNNSDQDSSVESENDDSHVSPEVLAESIRRKTDALHAQGLALADRLERMAEADDGDGEVDTAAMMTELLETASDLVEVAHAIETARLHDDSE
ncbi:hypothetical protein NGM10_05310 [Halorussus salilacus]|uniref:hypothetical protein n=1 Tax=Halorussus salilacus TaxID=2953750 RepID=UPI00209FFB4F|nr:hypothetical protein [Halorussus salilacus]USZ69157.1 hypothetical protein NGM10_05310 [Halorussus salilacus]